MHGNGLTRPENALFATVTWRSKAQKAPVSGADPADRGLSTAHREHGVLMFSSMLFMGFQTSSAPFRPVIRWFPWSFGLDKASTTRLLLKERKTSLLQRRFRKQG